MNQETDRDRRAFLRAAVAAGAGTLIAGSAMAGQEGGKPPEPKTEPKAKPDVEPKAKFDEKDKKEAEDVSPAEDLMREHGVLKRVLLVYGEVIRRLESGEDLAPEPVQDAVGIVRSFIQDSHEKLEEDFLFPRFRKAKLHEDLVDTLTAQHQAGRRVTEMTLRLTNLSSMRDPRDRPRLVGNLRAIIRMYEPHMAREDTVLFPALRKAVPAGDYAALCGDLGKKQRELLGDDGFEKVVDRVAALEKRFEIHELGKFTPFG